MRLLSRVLAFAPLVAAALAVDIHITSTQNVTIPSTLYGFFLEDVNHGGDGGIYAELIQNRAFQAVTPGTNDALYAWHPIGPAKLTVVNDTAGVSPALPNSLRVDVPTGTSTAAGVLNTGYWGMKIQSGTTYKGTFYAKSDTFRGDFTASLTSLDGSTTFASTTVAASHLSSEFTQFSYTLKAKKDAKDTNNVLRITFEPSHSSHASRASPSSDGHGNTQTTTVHFGLFTLFPPTFNDRPNGLRPDLVEILASSEPSFLRFPGGGNLLGENNTDFRWKWNATIGPLERRPGRLADWTYPNTDGLGLLEFFQLVEDLKMEPILAVWDGISTGNYSDLPDWPVVPEDMLQPYVDEAINEIEFLTGDAKTTKYGALRASYGREEPFALKYIEIGNEDQFQQASYQAYRWSMFVTQLGARFPDLLFIATCYPSLALDPPYTYIDFHMYNAPQWFTENAFMFDWDNYPRNGTQWFIGEWAVTSTNASDTLGTPDTGRLLYPTMQASSAEAAFLTGLERNSDIVFASSYAPLLNNNASTQWTPDLITFDAGSIAPSTSFWMHHMFSVNRGTHTLLTEPISSPDDAPLFWVASVDNATDTVFLKVANAGNTSVSATLSLGFSLASPKATVTVLTHDDPTAFNTLDAPELIVPVQQNLTMEDSSFEWTFPAYSVSVVSLQAAM